MAFEITSIIHAVAALLCIVELGMTAYVASLWQYGGNNYSPSVVNFMIFNSIWSLLVLAYVGITPMYMARAFHKLAALVLLSVTTLFWFAGSIAMAAWLGLPAYCSSNNACRTTQASVAFGFFIWVIFVYLTVVDGLLAWRHRSNPDSHHMQQQKPPQAYPNV